MRVLFFGDSITYGAWDTEGGWVERLKKDAHHQTVESEGNQKVQVINLGIGGDSSTKILKRMESEIQARYSKSWPFVLVVSCGANDERSINGKVETSLEEFGSNTNAIIELAKKYSDKVLFVGAPPIGQTVVNFKGQEYSDERLEEYEKKLKNLVESAGLEFLPVRPVFQRAGIEDLYSYDNIHPNDIGHELIYKAVKPKLEELLK